MQALSGWTPLPRAAMTPPLSGKRGQIMLWDIRARMKPALSVIDMIPDVHRTPALAALRRVVLDGRPLGLRLPPEEKELAFHEASVALTSPIGAQILLRLYRGGHLKLKKPPQKVLPTLEAYAATEADFRAEVARIIAAEDARRDRLAAIIADPALARPDEITPRLIDKVMTAHLGHGVYGSITIGGVACHRTLEPGDGADARLRAEPQVQCWWLDSAGQRQGGAV